MSVFDLIFLAMISDTLGNFVVNLKPHQASSSVAGLAQQSKSKSNNVRVKGWPGLINNSNMHTANFGLCSVSSSH